MPFGKDARGHILIVEDDQSLARMYRTALTFEGFDVAIATDGLSALRRIDEQTPDLVVLDLHLPRLRGEAVFDRGRFDVRRAGDRRDRR